MMRRKMLIVITLVTMMLFSCVAPVMQVFAADVAGTTTMTFNTSLYRGLKSYFQEKGIAAVYNDVERSIKMENSVLNGIEEISVKEKNIENVDGLQYFTNVKSLILSANSLSEKSNLEVLSGLTNLEYLDLSSNNISDVSGIEDLITDLLAENSSAVNLSGQTTHLVVDVEMDVSEEKLVYEANLPQILTMAGIADAGIIDNRGELKAEWIVQDSRKSSASIAAPYVVTGSVPNPVSSSDLSFEIQVGLESGGVYTPLEGLVKLEVSIKDISIGAYNPNPATRNLLKDSKFYVYYVVHTAEKEGVIIKDKNLYTAIKEQLTEDQMINKDLLSYPYTLDENGEVYYNVCSYTTSGTTATLKVGSETLYKIFNFEQEGEYIEDASGNRVDLEYEFVYEETTNASGVVTRTRRIKIPNINIDKRDLYVDAYDDALAFVITDLDIINKIGSLILNDQRITDLSGLEKFVGLESNLNVSYNYIDTLATIYALQINKNNMNAELQRVFKEKLSSMKTSKDKVDNAYDDAKDAIENIEKKVEAIQEKIALLATATAEEQDKLKEEINKLVKEIYGGVDDEGNEVEGLIDEIEEALDDPQDGLNANLNKLYSRLATMYTVYNKEYKLTTLLIPELNYLTEEEYEETLEKFKSLEEVKSLAKSQISRIGTLEKAGALTPVEKELIVEGFGLALSTEEEYPISKAFDDIVKSMEETNASRTAWKNICTDFQEINIYTSAITYCTLERMNNVTALEECLVKEYLSKQIKEYDYEGIDTSLLVAIKGALNGETTSGYTTALYDIFEDYIEGHKTVDGTDIYNCKGPYREVEKVEYDKVEATTSGVTYPTRVYLFETIETSLTSDKTEFLEMLLALANKFTALNEVERYVVLPNLKRIDVSNNKIETLGDTEVTMVKSDGTTETTTENLASLENLKEFYAAHNFVTGNLDCVDWTQLTSLKKLDLAYNFIRDISKLQVLVNLRYLDVSDNLLEGAFNLAIREFTKLKDLKLAGNKYTDLNKILVDYEMIAGGDFTRYFAREDTVNLDLSRQKHEIIIEEPIKYDSSKTVLEVELPPIYSQIEYIDATRTAFGTTSYKGTITATGEVAYVPIDKVGDYEAKVTVIAANGYPEDVTTSLGMGSECVIKYSVKEINVDSVTINEDISKLEVGTTQTFTATVTGNNVPDTTVAWAVEGASSLNTRIDENGVLVIGADETATTITIHATSNYDDTKTTSKTIELFKKTVTSVTINEENVNLEKGKTATFTATVEGENLEDADKTVAWSVVGAEKEGTKIDENGVLTIADDETATAVTVVATSNCDGVSNDSEVVGIVVKTVTGVNIAETARMKPGETLTLTATVEGENLEDADKGVTWAVFGNTDPYTMINPVTGVLTISENEDADKLVVAATSKFDNAIIGTAEVQMIIVRNIKVESDVNQANKADRVNFTATVEGSNLTDAEKEVTWEVSGANDGKTMISTGGVLTVGADETAAKLVVKATSTTDTDVFGTKEIEITIPVPTLGYDLDENDETLIVGVSPSTKVANFKSKLVTDDRYTVVVKRNGAEVAADSNVATGDMAVIYFGDTLVETYEIVVKGDVNGDGLADALDSSLIKAHRARLTILTGSFFKAADLDSNNEISVRDVRLLLYHRARIDGYIL